MNCTPPDDPAVKQIPYQLLEYCLFPQMTSKEQAQFITHSYQSALTPFDFSLNCDEDVRSMTTHDLIWYILYNDTSLGDYLLEVAYHTDSHPDTRLEIYRLLRKYSNVLLELETRDDALEELEIACNDSATYRTAIPILYNLWPEITA